MHQSTLSTFYIVCILGAVLREVRWTLVLAIQDSERILLILLTWMNPGCSGADASVGHPGVMVLDLLPSEDQSDQKALTK